jgi:hypothetical protein
MASDPPFGDTWLSRGKDPFAWHQQAPVLILHHVCN